MITTDKIASLFSSASELQTIATNSHLLWGIPLLLVSILLIIYSFGFRKRLLSIITPIILLLTVVIFGFFLFLNQGLTNFWTLVQIVASLPELYVHLIMSALATIGIVIEILVATGKNKHPLAPLALPLLSTIGVGLLFIVHPQSGLHDNNTMFIHSLIGSAFVLTGIMLILQRLVKIDRYELLFGTLAAISLAFAAILLIQFKESPLAYQSYFPTTKSMSTPPDLGNKTAIYITSQGVTPQNIRIKKGGEVIFYQLDSSLHDMNSGPHPTHTEYPPLNIGILKQDESKTVIMRDLGVYGFHDHINDSDPIFQGQIEVYE